MLGEPTIHHSVAAAAAEETGTSRRSEKRRERLGVESWSPNPGFLHSEAPGAQNSAEEIEFKEPG
ncbi:MAG: hypothetical protein DMG58_19860 [Acidobacteria bacterium]|nr:MAG: hypothetical protein DMG58_19860 [Acidobacteriota bacterium]